MFPQAVIRENNTHYVALQKEWDLARYPVCAIVTLVICPGQVEVVQTNHLAPVASGEHISADVTLEVARRKTRIVVLPPARLGLCSTY